MSIWESVIGGASKLIGGWFDNKSADERQAQNLQAQREFAQSGIQWKVKDARAAGIHPLYALGASTHSFTPSTVGGPSWADTLGSVGQDIGRAVSAASTKEDKNAVVNGKILQLNLEKGALENDLLRTQIRRLNAETGPAMPTLKDKNAIEGQPITDRKVDTGAKAGESRKYNLAADIPIDAVKSETKAETLEDEYGDESIINFISNNYRQIRDLIETGRRENSKKYWGGRTGLDRARSFIRRNWRHS